MNDDLLGAIMSRWRHLSLGNSGSLEIISNAEDLLELGTLRYKRFVEDQGQPYRSNEGMHRCLVDPIDRLSVNFIGRREGVLVLALRLSWWSDIRRDDYLYGLKAATENIIGSKRAFVCSRLISNGLADLPRLVLMFRHAYETGLLSGGEYSILSTLPSRMLLFERFGYRDTGRVLQDPIAGPQHIMLIPMPLAQAGETSGIAAYRRSVNAW